MKRIIISLVFTPSVLCTIMWMFLDRPKTIQSPMTNTTMTPPIIILYNRVPKCGSSLMIKLIDALSNRTGAFTSIQHQTIFDHRITREAEQNITTMLDKSVRIANYQSLVYVKHFYFVNFTLKSDIVFYYINQLRDPVTRTISNFNFRRRTCAIAPNLDKCVSWPQSIQRLTMDESVSTGDPGRCITNLYGVRSPIAYFCGHSSVCDDIGSGPISDAALALAKSNIERYYIHIGLLEYLESSLELLEHIQPSIFTGLLNIYVNVFKRRRMNVLPKNDRYSTTNKTRDILRQLLNPEYELYNFVRMRFFDHYTRVFHRAPMGPTT